MATPGIVSRTEHLTDAQWSLIEPMLPSSDGLWGRPLRNNRRVVEGIVYRYRAGIAWRDVPAEFGPWQTIWKRHRRYAGDGTWDTILAARTRPDAVLGDKAYSSKANRRHLWARGIEAVITEPDDQKRNRVRRGSRAGRPVQFDAEKYKGRNVVERSFCTLKQWRALATCYDKLALTYRAGVMLSAVCTWLRLLAD